MSAPLNILQISPRVPWPVADGATIGIYNITRSVAARGHRITFAAFGKTGTDSGSSSDANDMPSFCRLEIIAHDTSNSVWKALRNLPSHEPYPISKYHSAAMTARIDALCEEERFDIVHVDHAHMAMYGEYVQRRFGIPYVLREHNFETTIYRRYAERMRLPVLSHYFRMQAARMYKYESSVLTHPDVIAAITPEDAVDIRTALGTQGGAARRSAKENIRIIPAGVDVKRMRPFNTEPNSAHVVVVGPLVWAPNIDAATWFATEIWPRIKAAVPEARCTIAGASPPRRLLRLATEDLRIPGFVDDYAELLSSATVMAVPLRIGGGMRVKLLEFFACGKAVVSTAIGAEGNAARDGEQYISADSAGDFAAAVVAIIRNPELRRSIGLAARTLAKQTYSWDHIGELFEKAYLEAVALRSGS
ncbi:MAG: glycosyltransferase family 4 protein [Bacteroidota bacterium]